MPKKQKALFSGVLLDSAFGRVHFCKTKERYPARVVGTRPAFPFLFLFFKSAHVLERLWNILLTIIGLVQTPTTTLFLLCCGVRMQVSFFCNCGRPLFCPGCGNIFGDVVQVAFETAAESVLTLSSVSVPNSEKSRYSVCYTAVPYDMTGMQYTARRSCTDHIQENI